GTCLNAAPMGKQPRMADESPTLDLIERLAAAPDRMTFDALQRVIGLPEGQLRGRLAQLVARGWVEAADDGRSYAIVVGALRPGHPVRAKPARRRREPAP